MKKRQKVGLAIFLVLFAVVGARLLFFSHAATLQDDINGDGVVNIFDLSLLLSSYGKSQSTCVTDSSYICDINADGVVNIFDLSVLVSNLGNTGSISGGPIPVGQPVSAWTHLVFDDEFNGTSLDTSRWGNCNNFTMNNVTTSASNLSESGGVLTLTLASSSSGAMISSSKNFCGAGANAFELPVGGYVEGRIKFPGPASGDALYDWPAFWMSSTDGAISGEIDIAEGLGPLTVNYHSRFNGATDASVATPPGTWQNAFHTFAAWRKSDHFEVYYDGNLVASYPTNDAGGTEAIIINVGDGHGMYGQEVYGAGSQVQVDYVRAWEP